jgi:hypothetical protein
LTRFSGRISRQRLGVSGVHTAASSGFKSYDPYCQRCENALEASRALIKVK